MPYIFCESCGEGAYSNVTSCPRCGRIARLARPRRLLWRIPAVDRSSHGTDMDRSSHGAEEVEYEVREMLYGWRSQAVQPRRQAS